MILLNQYIFSKVFAAISIKLTKRSNVMKKKINKTLSLLLALVLVLSVLPMAAVGVEAEELSSKNGRAITADGITFEDSEFYDIEMYSSENSGEGNSIEGYAAPAATIEFNEENFPDACFRDFLEYEVFQPSDILPGNLILESTFQQVKFISISDNQIKNLEGISFFTNLEILGIFSSKITSLDVSCFKKLQVLDCRDLNLPTVTISDLPNLEVIHFSNTNTNTLNLSNLPELQALWFPDNNMTSIDISQFSKLSEFGCFNNNISEIDLTHNPNLRILSVGGNPISDFAFSHLTKLEFFACDRLKLTALDVSTLVNLKELYCNENKIKTLSVNNSPKLEALACYSNELTKLTIKNTPNLYYLDCYDNRLSALNLSGVKALRAIDCSQNYFEKKSDITGIANIPWDTYQDEENFFIFSPQSSDTRIPFKDVKTHHWYYDAVAYAYENNTMAGVSSTKFDPNAKLTRAMMVQILYNLDGAKTEATSAFTDVPAGKWFSSSIAWAAENKIVAGYGNGKFGPNDSITREQMAVILNNYCNFKGITLPVLRDEFNITDKNLISKWASEAIEAMYKASILNGKGAGKFDPKGTATRAEVASMMKQFMENTK